MSNIYHGVKGERISMAQKQNKNKCCVCSPMYGSMTFWKNKDFWKSMLMYACGGVMLLLFLTHCAKTIS